LAAWRQEWEGLLAAACGMSTLETARGVYSKTFQILIHALVAARNRRSRDGVAAVAQALAAMGEPKAADMAVANIRADWPEEARASPGTSASACW